MPSQRWAHSSGHSCPRWSPSQPSAQNLHFWSSDYFCCSLRLVGLGKFASRREMFKLIWMPVVLAIVAALSAGQALKNSAGQVYETESAYNYIQVQEQNGYTLLKLNDGQGVHSIYHPDTLNYGGPWEQFLVGPYFYANRKPQDVKRMAIVGLAAGTAARQATAVYGDIPIDGFELDGKIVEVGEKYFGMNLPNLTVHIGDGRLNLERSPYKYDIIAVDAYRPPYIPPHMTTQEFFEIAASHLTDDGVLTINVGSVPGDRRLIRRTRNHNGHSLPLHSHHGYPRHTQHHDLRHQTADHTRKLHRKSGCTFHRPKCPSVA